MLKYAFSGVSLSGSSASQTIVALVEWAGGSAILKALGVTCTGAASILVQGIDRPDITINALPGAPASITSDGEWLVTAPPGYLQFSCTINAGDSIQITSLTILGIEGR